MGLDGVATTTRFFENCCIMVAICRILRVIVKLAESFPRARDRPNRCASPCRTQNVYSELLLRMTRRRQVCQIENWGRMGAAPIPDSRRRALSSEGTRPTKSKIAAGIFGILLGALGIHKFYLGYIGAGIVHLVLTLLIITSPISSIIGLIEGILYLVKTDGDFHETYVMNRKSWF